MSVVQHNERPDCLLVRSRIQGDIERAVPGAAVFEDETADYRYRSIIPKEVFKAALAAAVDAIDYPNFKNSVGASDHARHSAYMGVWQVMAKAFGAYGRR